MPKSPEVSKSRLIPIFIPFLSLLDHDKPHKWLRPRFAKGPSKGSPTNARKGGRLRRLPRADRGAAAAAAGASHRGPLCASELGRRGGADLLGQGTLWLCQQFAIENGYL